MHVEVRMGYGTKKSSSKGKGKKGRRLVKISKVFFPYLTSKGFKRPQ